MDFGISETTSSLALRLLRIASNLSFDNTPADYGDG
jgi:hypothetical protein